jgi:hypothetical protein
MQATDADPNDNFGYSVSHAESNGDSLVLVGAPSKEDNGRMEQQSILCDATSGVFTVSYRGFTYALGRSEELCA